MAGYNNNVKNNLTAVFQDTLDFINEEEDLYDCIEYSKRESELIKADEYYDLETPNRAGKIKVTQSKTFEAAMRYAEDEANADKLIAVLNFVSFFMAPDLSGLMKGCWRNTTFSNIF